MKFVINATIESVPDESPPRLVFTIFTDHNLIIKDPKMLILQNDQQVKASIQPIDAKGNPAKIDGDPTWTSSNEQIAVVTPDPSDGSGTWTSTITAGAQLGTCQINVTADADLGSGTTTINGVLDLQIVAGAAVGFQIQTGAPEPIVPAKA